MPLKDSMDDIDSDEMKNARLIEELVKKDNRKVKDDEVQIAFQFSSGALCSLKFGGCHNALFL